MYTSTSRLKVMPCCFFGRASVLLSKLPGVATLFLGKWLRQGTKVLGYPLVMST